MSGWRIDEGVFAGAEHLDEAFVAGYDDKAQFDPTDDVEALRSHGLGEGTTVLDLGAGTGTFALAAAATGARVIAVDISPVMVAAMRHRLDGMSAVTVVEAGLLSYGHVGEPVDLVFSRNALHQLPDFWKVLALRRVAAMMRPGGILRLRDLVYDMEPDGIEAEIDGWVGGGGDDPARGYTAADLADHVRQEHSTFTWLLEPMLERTGFDVLDRSVRRSVYATYTCRRRA